ncbi:MAG: glycosyltransferase family protein [Rickettsiales bacterium]|nr:glycosyltransferase family protein [Rickettsiales bacterium]MDG4548787.1 glycosyltransferase family protein [Rickettsiales bacterium]
MMPHNDIVAIIQARMSSTRLPGKVLLALCDNTVLGHVVKRVSTCPLIDKVVVATTELGVDDAIVAECKRIGVDYSRESSDDVLSRYYDAAKKFNAKNIIRVTSDCPVISGGLLTKMIAEYLDKKPDYLSNTIERTFPRGLDIEIFGFETLEKTYKNAAKDYEKEHVTPYVYQNEHEFDILHYKDKRDNSIYRWTLDTPEDLDLIERIYSYLYAENNNFEYEDILRLFKKHPELININRNIEQKKLGN